MNKMKIELTRWADTIISILQPLRTDMTKDKEGFAVFLAEFQMPSPLGIIATKLRLFDKDQKVTVDTYLGGTHLLESRYRLEIINADVIKDSKKMIEFIYDGNWADAELWIQDGFDVGVLGHDTGKDSKVLSKMFTLEKMESIKNFLHGKGKPKSFPGFDMQTIFHINFDTWFNNFEINNEIELREDTHAVTVTSDIFLKGVLVAQNQYSIEPCQKYNISQTELSFYSKTKELEMKLTISKDGKIVETVKVLA